MSILSTIDVLQSHLRITSLLSAPSSNTETLVDQRHSLATPPRVDQSHGSTVKQALRLLSHRFVLFLSGRCTTVAPIGLFGIYKPLPNLEAFSLKSGLSCGKTVELRRGRGLNEISDLE